MRKIYLLASVILTLLLPRSPAISAQATPVATCDPAGLIAQLSGLKATNKSSVDLHTLDDIANQISSQRIACSGLTFSGTGSKVLDPFTLPAGNYRVKLFASDNLSLVTIKALGEGNCSGALSKNINEAVVSADVDCRATISTMALNKIAEWTVTFEPLK